MAKINKVEQLQLGERVLELSAAGLSTAKIADVVSRELKDESISQRSIARYLKEVREDRASETRAVVQEHIKATVPVDLLALDEAESYHLAIARNHGWDPGEIRKNFLSALSEKKHWTQAEIIETYEGIFRQAEKGQFYDVKIRSAAYMNAVKIVETKLRFAGVLENPDEEASELKRTMDDLLNELDGSTSGIPVSQGSSIRPAVEA
ncbi:MAG: hypothetical protein C4530_11465 [Desulfobacteraceae bacterium]|nr:MAG: hypothetical protein C4530_11465 [Desulfobacteraceae bacterium]